MPLFSKKGSRGDSKVNSKENGSKGTDFLGSKAAPTASPVSPTETDRGGAPIPHEQVGAVPNQGTTEAEQLAKRLIFHAQLAHGSPTGKIENFANVKELYQRIGDAFSISPNEIIFCTLNSPKIDMEKLLGGQIGLDDLIFAHIKGEAKDVEAIKIGSALGLTITDNGNGIPFIKRIREGSVMEKHGIKVGDHIEMIEGISYVGSRHFEVAKVLRDIEKGSRFTMKLIEPKKAFEGIAPRQSKGQTSASNSNAIGSGKATLRLRSNGPAYVEMEQPQWEAVAITKVDDLLENFIGIRDQDLASSLVDIGKHTENPSDFASVVEERFGEFEFPDDFIFDIWGAIGDAKAGRL